MGSTFAFAATLCPILCVPLSPLPLALIVSGVSAVVRTGKGFDSTSESTVVFHPTPKIGAINYGFHDAGEGRRSQIYLYATPDQSNWLGDFIAEDPRWLKKPFSVLALPASHDSGMYGPLDGGLAALIEEGKWWLRSLPSSKALLTSLSSSSLACLRNFSSPPLPGHLGNALANHVATNIASPAIRGIVDLLELIKLRPARVIGNIAMTQKDSIQDQLKIVSMWGIEEGDPPAADEERRARTNSGADICSSINRVSVTSTSGQASASTIRFTHEREGFTTR